jgi:prolyl-tRNA synthetase
VGHIFCFGTKYSRSMNFTVTGQDGSSIFPEMGSYGIGVSRLVGAIVEAYHDDKGIIWPTPVAPFDAMILSMTSDATSMADALYSKLKDLSLDVLYDDRDERPGVKFADADMIGIPWQIIVGKKTTDDSFELRRRGQPSMSVSFDTLVQKIRDGLSEFSSKH